MWIIQEKEDGTFERIDGLKGVDVRWNDEEVISEWENENVKSFYSSKRKDIRSILLNSSLETEFDLNDITQIDQETFNEMIQAYKEKLKGE